MIVIDGTNAVMGRLASYVAKQALGGGEVAIVNVEKVIITGNRTDIKKRFLDARAKIGSGQRGPMMSKSPEKIVKKAIRGMLPNHREGRGRIAYKKIKCYVGVPREFEKSEKISAGKEKLSKFVRVDKILR